MVKVVNAWDTYAVRHPDTAQLIDYDADLWEDAKLGEVEEWLVNHLRNRGTAKRRATMMRVT